MRKSNLKAMLVEEMKLGYLTGGTYVLSKVEKKAADFSANMDSIEKITFGIDVEEEYEDV